MLRDTSQSGSASACRNCCAPAHRMFMAMPKRSVVGMEGRRPASPSFHTTSATSTEPTKALAGTRTRPAWRSAPSRSSLCAAPPSAIKAATANKAAPADNPSSPGPASGFWNTPCTSTPATASDAPVPAMVSALHRRRRAMVVVVWSASPSSADHNWSWSSATSPRRSSRTIPASSTSAKIQGHAPERRGRAGSCKVAVVMGGGGKPLACGATRPWIGGRGW